MTVSTPTGGSPAASPTGDDLYPRLLADIGGTRARFAWQAQPGAEPSHPQTLAVADHSGLAQAAAAYLQGLSQHLGADYRAPRSAGLAVATAVTGDQVNFTNSHWSFSRLALCQSLGLARPAVVNDFEALALALPQLTPAQWRRHAQPAWPTTAHAATGTVLAVLGPGTGLGVGAVLKTPVGWQAIAGEGGHATLAAGDALEAELIGIVRRQHPHVSAERLLSGTGLPLLHAALAEVNGWPQLEIGEALDAKTIVAQALADDRSAAAQTLDLFCAMLGSFAGDVVLTLGARGGLYIGGGVVPRFADRFFASAFRQRFQAKGRFHDYLAGVPSALITDTRAALNGAAIAIDGA
ncbi:MAG: glucokinase [Rubrivivax sp.]|nr:glucokinase [Rubrivivax sp.]